MLGHTNSFDVGEIPNNIHAVNIYEDNTLSEVYVAIAFEDDMTWRIFVDSAVYNDVGAFLSGSAVYIEPYYSQERIYNSDGTPVESGDVIDKDAEYYIASA